jgi:pimeloyl-ACP methyl ester carboxylesterase
MLPRVAALAGIATYVFDYSKRSLQWVDDDAIGPKLSAAVQCLAKRTGRRVIVVGHSMGGLATRWAQAQPLTSGGHVADLISQVITIGTPSDGSQFLELVNVGEQAALAGSFASGNAVPALAVLGLEAVLHVCGWWSAQAGAPSRCGLVGLPRSPAGQAMTPGSPQLQAPARPPWASTLPVTALVADEVLTFNVGFAKATVHLGDVVVGTHSQAASADAGATPTIETCNVNLASVFSSLCFHVNEPYNPHFASAVVDSVQATQAREALTSTQPSATGPPCTGDAIARAANIQPGTAPYHWANIHCADGWARADFVYDPQVQLDSAVYIFRAEGAEWVLVNYGTGLHASDDFGGMPYATCLKVFVDDTSNCSDLTDTSGQSSGAQAAPQGFSATFAGKGGAASYGVQGTTISHIALRWTDSYSDESGFRIVMSNTNRCSTCSSEPIFAPANTDTYELDIGVPYHASPGDKLCFEIRAQFSPGSSAAETSASRTCLVLPA